MTSAFFIQFCDVAKLVIIKQEDLFGYRSNIKYKFFKNPLIFWLLVELGQ
jgi:hypothetical protein